MGECGVFAADMIVTGEAARADRRQACFPLGTVHRPPQGWVRFSEVSVDTHGDRASRVAMVDSTVLKTTRVLVVEDSPEFLQLIRAALERESGFAIETCMDGRSAIDAARACDPDVVVLDLGLPGMDGVEVCRELRTFTDAYVLMLTARDEEIDRLVGLAVGADDYMTKPFSPRELVARLQVLMRRPRGGIRTEAPAGGDVVDLADLRLDPQAREVHVGGRPVDLTKIEFDLLAVLAGRPGMVFTRQMLVDTVWGHDWYGDDHMVSVHIANLRKKIDSDGSKHIITIRGVGYRFAVRA